MTPATNEALVEWNYGSTDPDFRLVSDWLERAFLSHIGRTPWPAAPPDLSVGKVVTAGRTLTGCYARVISNAPVTAALPAPGEVPPHDAEPETEGEG